MQAMQARPAPHGSLMVTHLPRAQNVHAQQLSETPEARLEMDESKEVDLSRTRLWLGPHADTPFANDPSLVTGLADYSEDPSRASWPTLAWTKAHRLHDIKTLCDGCAALDVTTLVEGAPPTKLLDDFNEIEKNAGRCRLCALMAQTYRGIEGVHYRQNFVYRMRNHDASEGPVMVYKTEGHLGFGVLMPENWPDSQQGSKLFPWEFGRFAIEVPAEGERAVADTAAEARALVLRRELRRTSSEAGWCLSCAPETVASTGHGQSAPTHIATPLLPYRVVEILGSPKTTHGLTNLRLKTSEAGQAVHAPYATLSHRWGGISTLKTTRETLPDRTLGFLFSEMPRTFQDAVLVASALGFRYVWIDSLCIVQDDEAEWREQSAVMGAIYMNASLTIAAHSAAQCNEGFLWRSQVPSCLHIPSTPAAFSLSLPHLESSQLRRRFFESEIAKRAWVLQELTLSRRILHFVEDHVFWECEHVCGVPTRNPPEGDSIDSSLEGMYPLPAATSAAIFRTATSTLSVHSAWLGLVQRYSEYHMTQKGDKLVAVSGIANVLRQAYRDMSGEEQEHSLDDYHCGVFAGDVPRSLLWFNKAKSSGSQIERHLERAPTWSWASVDCVLSFPALALDTDGDLAWPLVMLRVRSCRHRGNVGLPGRGPSCRLVVEAPLFHIPSGMVQVKSKHVLKPTPIPRLVVRLCREGDNEMTGYGWFIPDETDVLPGVVGYFVFPGPPVVLSFVAVRGRVVNGDVAAAYCLVVRPVEGRPGEYRRIGLSYLYNRGDDIRNALAAPPGVLTLV